MIGAALSLISDAGERRTLEKFYKKNRRKLYSIAFSKLHNIHDAEDAIQEAFLRITEKPDKFFSISEEERIYYVAAIVNNISVDLFNKRNKHNAEEVNEDLIYKSDEHLIENSLLEKIEHCELLDFINNLPELQRNVLILTCLSEHTIKETADILKVSENVVSQRLFLARKSIKAFVERRKNE